MNGEEPRWQGAIQDTEAQEELTIGSASGVGKWRFVLMSMQWEIMEG
jgi:hypothetical protein